MMHFTQLFKSAACATLLAGSMSTYAQEGSITLAVSDISAMDATVSISTNPEDLTYYWNFMDKESFEALGGADKILDYCIDRWENLASWYDNTTWQEMMGYELVDYPMTESISGYFYETLMYDTDYVAYAFGMDRDANLTAPVSTAEFKTLTPPTSDNTFEITMGAMENAGFYLSTTAHVEPSNSDRYMVEFFTKEFVDKFDITPGSAAEKRFIADEMLYYLDDEDVASGPHDFTFSRCKEGTSYYAIAMGLNEDNTPSTGLTMAEFTAVVEETPMQGSIELEVSDITPMNAHIRIVPSDDNIRYYYSLTRPEIIEMKGGIDNIAEKLVIDWWKFLADIYGGAYTWQDFIPYQTTTGVIDDTVANLAAEGELEDLYWNSDWVLYAVGFDLEGNVITKTATLEFSTPDTEKSNLTFDFAVEDIALNPASTEKRKLYDVTIDVIPSSDEETFRAKYMEMKYYDQYLDDPDPDMFDFITRQFLPYSIEFEGPMRLILQQLNVYDYYGDPIEWGLFTIGWNEGPTTDVYHYSFNLENLLSGLGDALGDAVKVKGGRGILSIDGDYAGAAIYSLDGRLAGGLQPGHSLHVAPGVYIVNYTTNGGMTRTRKVIVK